MHHCIPFAALPKGICTVDIRREIENVLKERQVLSDMFRDLGTLFVL
jgi:hypothetical protein